MHNLGPLGPNSGHQNFFIIPVVRNCFKLSSYAISRKTNEPNLRKWQKPWFQAQFWPVWPKFGSEFFSWILLLLDVRHCRKLSLYAISRKAYDPSLSKWPKKTHFGPDLGSSNLNSGHLLFFFKSWKFFFNKSLSKVAVQLTSSVQQTSGKTCLVKWALIEQHLV